MDNEFKAEMTMTNVMVKSEHFSSEMRPRTLFSSGMIDSRGPDSSYSISLGPGVRVIVLSAEYQESPIMY